MVTRIDLVTVTCSHLTRKWWSLAWCFSRHLWTPQIIKRLYLDRLELYFDSSI